jgi:hypothetical protein
VISVYTRIEIMKLISKHMYVLILISIITNDINIIYVCVYVDDIYIVGNNRVYVDDIYVIGNNKSFINQTID